MRKSTFIIPVIALLLFTSATPASAALTEDQIQSILAVLSSFGADVTTVANVNAALRDLPTSSGGASSCISLSSNLSAGSTDSTTGGQVTQLQQFLSISPTTGYFGPITEQAVKDWQSSHGVVSSGTPDTTGYGFVGPATRAAMSCSGTTQPVYTNPTAPSCISPMIWNGSTCVVYTEPTAQTATSASSPTVTSVSIVSPTNPPPSTSTLTLMINGSNFQPGASIVYGNGSLLSSTFIDSSHLQFGPYAYNPGVYAFRVKNRDGQLSRDSASITVGQSTVVASTPPVNTPATPPACIAPPTPVSYSGPIPTTCFGRKVIYTDNGSDGRGPGRVWMQPNTMHLIRIKTGSAGNANVIDWITDANVAGMSGATLGFISPTPCDYTDAYNNALVKMGSPSGGGDWGAPSGPLPTLAENQVKSFFDRPENIPPAWTMLPNANTYIVNAPAYRKAYLKPNTVYFIHVINSEAMLAPFDQVPTKYIKTTADLTASPDTCTIANCTYEYFDFMNFSDNATNKISGLPAPTTQTTVTSTSCPAPSSIKAYIANTNTSATRWVENGSVLFNEPLFIKTTGLVQSRTPKGCVDFANAHGCDNPPTNYREFTTAEWGGSTTQVITSSAPGAWPVGAYAGYIYYPGEVKQLVGTFTITGSTGGSCGGAIVTPATGGGTASSCVWSYSGFSPPMPAPSFSCTQSNAGQEVVGIAGKNTCTCTQQTATPVNGTCGASACGSFSSPPTTILCYTGTASAVSGSGPFTWFCNGSGGGSSVSCSATKSSTGTTPPPPAVSCGAGEVFNTGTGDRDWQAETGMHVVHLWPIPAVTGSGALGRAIKIVADNVKYPRGIQVGGVDESHLGGKDYVVSACPHSFVPVGNNARCTLTGAGSVAGPLYLRFGPAEPRTFFGVPLPSLDCSLTPGGTYYVNFRAYDPSYPTVSSQFVTYDRAIASE